MSLEPINLQNIKNINLFPIPNLQNNFLITGAVRKGAYINMLNQQGIEIAGAVRGLPESELYFFHIHFRGLSWFKEKFKKMKYKPNSGGSSFHWKNYTKKLNEKNYDIETIYKTIIKKNKEQNNIKLSTLIIKFKNYFNITSII